MDDYKATAYRMHIDAELLYKNKRWFNTCYLSGYVIECYCKLFLGICTGKSGKEFSHRLNDMKKEMGKIILQKNIYPNYCLDLVSVCPAIMQNWNPGLRYNDDSSAFNEENMAKTFIEEQKEVMAQIAKMIVDGVI